MDDEQGLDRQSGRSPKTASILETDSISPLMKGNHKAPEGGEEALDLDRSTKQFSVGLGSRRLQGRPSIDRLSSRQSNLGESPSAEQVLSEITSRPSSQHGSDGLIAQISAWIKQEKARRTARKAKAKASREGARDVRTATSNEVAPKPTESSSHDPQLRRQSDASEGAVALDELVAIIERTALQKDKAAVRKPSQYSRQLSLQTKGRPRSYLLSSDTEVDPEVNVPHTNVVLDNSKTLAYTGGTAEPSDGSTTPGRTSKDSSEAWATFKYEIVRLAHTLKLKSWRRVPLERSSEIDVERLSGALTNAVYFVKPPKDLPEQEPRYDDAGNMIAPKKPPPELLLRIYGPQVEHLIDRESELQILRRLRRKNIGPRLLGTFTNGRFEEYLHSRTLKEDDLRVPETSKQIAKRMRELHEGIDLLPKEREGGPFVWKCWEKWVDRCEQIVNWLDQEVLAAGSGEPLSKGDAWKQRGFVCGTEWHLFKKAVDKYRKWLEDQYGGLDKILERMVFAHNDTQYGNILRLIPPGESPLLLPANEHKQLVVIDFEYANANLPGYEFANHFTEWSYNYHDPVNSHSIIVSRYPSEKEQYRFIRAYVLHRPAFSQTSTPTTPALGPTAIPSFSTSSSNISSFMLDSRAPPTVVNEQIDNEEKTTNKEIERLMAETRVWRAASSAHWIAWGIVQAKVPGMPDLNLGEGKDAESTTVSSEPEEASSKEMMSDPLTEEALEASEDFAAKRPDPLGEPEEEEEEEEEFDYLAYAQQRAMFFWGDAIRLGIIGKEELPESVRDKVLLLDY